MKPEPLASLNHLTVPVAMIDTSFLKYARTGQEGKCAQPNGRPLNGRTVADVSPDSNRAPGDRNRHRDPGAAAGLGVDIQIAAGEAQPLLEGVQSEVQPDAVRVPHLYDVEANTVVGHPALDDPSALGEADVHVRRAGVLADVGQRLAHGSVDQRLGRLVVPVKTRPNGDLEAGALAQLVGENADRAAYAVRLERRRAQLEAESAGAVSGLGKRLARLAGGACRPGRVALVGRTDHPV